MLPNARAIIARLASRLAWLTITPFGAEVDPYTELIPTYGSKEAIFLFPLVVCGGDKNVVVIPEPAYPVYERGAAFAGAETHFVPLREGNAWLPDLDAIDEKTWSRCAIFWLNYPHNPTGAVAPLSFYEELAERAREHGFYLASDEAYSELWFDEPPDSAVQLADGRSQLIHVPWRHQPATSFQDHGEVRHRAGHDRLSHRHGLEYLHGHLVARRLAAQLGDGNDVGRRKQPGKSGVRDQRDPIQSEPPPLRRSEILRATRDRQADARQPADRLRQWFHALVRSRSPGEQHGRAGEAESAASLLPVYSNGIEQFGIGSMRDQGAAKPPLESS